MTAAAGARPSAVRLIAGKWKGRTLDVPDRARPTASRAREALFSMLQDSVPGARFLDLYAGSGAVGLEAASRGAARVVLVEEEGAALARTLRRLAPLSEEVVLLREPVPHAVVRLAGAGERFDLVFSDPPYSEPVDASFGGWLAALLAPGGVFILQRDARQTPPELENLTQVRRKDHGRNVLHLYALSATRCSPLRGAGL